MPFFVQIKSLTTSADNFTGGTGNDGFDATIATISTLDTLRGGAGNDTLNILDNGTASVTVAAANTSGIEIINLRSTGATTGTTAVAENATVTFSAMKTGQYLTVAGVTLVATADLTAANVASAMTGGTVTGASVRGTISGWTVAANANNENQAIYTQTGTAANVADLSSTVSGTEVTGQPQLTVLTAATNFNNGGGTVSFTYNGTTVTTATLAASATPTTTAAAIAAAINGYAGTTIATASAATVVVQSNTPVSLAGFAPSAAGTTFTYAAAPASNVIAYTTTSGAAASTFSVVYNGVSISASVPASSTVSAAATLVAAAINSYVGSTVAVANGTAGQVAISVPSVIGTLTQDGTTTAANTATGSTSGIISATPLTIVEVQGVPVVNSNATTGTITATSFVGATDFNADRASSPVNIDSLAAGQKFGMIGNGTVTNANVQGTYASTVTSGTINVAGGTLAGTITEVGAGITSNTINSTGAANKLTAVVLSGTANTALTINADTNLDVGTGITGFTGSAASTITISGAATSVKLGTIEASTVGTVNASGLSVGGITATASSAVKSIVGGAGVDTITTGAATATGAVIDGGVGSADVLVLAATNDVTTTAKGAQYINFETLKSLQTSSYDASLIAGITSLDSGVGGAGFTKMTAAQASKVTVSASLAATGTTFALADATGSSDVLNLTFKNATATTLENATALTVDGFETVNLTASSGGTTIVSKTAGTDYDQFKFSSTTGTTTVTLAGAFAAQVDISSNATGVTALNASANTADVSLVTGGQTGALVVTGSAGKDTITVNAVGTKGTISVDAGANDDTITVAAGALTNKVTINGGAGTKDTLANTASSAQDFGILGITNVETFTLTSDAAATDAVVGDFRNVTGLTTLKVVGGDATDTFTLNRLDGATVLEIGSATGVITTTINSGTTQSASFKSNVTAGGLTLDNGTTTLTVTSSDGDTTADEAMGAITTLAGSGLTRLVVLGDDRFDPGTVGTTVTTVDASGSTGGLTVIASSSATALIGGGAADTLTGGSGADTITGGKGADTIDGKGGRDTIVFATTGADNGIDVLTGFTVGSGSSADIFNFKNFLSGGSVDQSSGTGTAIVAYTSGTTTDINIANKVAFYSDATQANIDTAAEIAALIQGAGNAFSLTSGGKAILVTGDASGTNDVTIIWYVNDALDGAAGTISATDVVQVGYIGVTNAASAIDLDTLITTQFIFA